MFLKNPLPVLLVGLTLAVGCNIKDIQNEVKDNIRAPAQTSTLCANPGLTPESFAAEWALPSKSILQFKATDKR